MAFKWGGKEESIGLLSVVEEGKDRVTIVIIIGIIVRVKVDVVASVATTIKGSTFGYYCYCYYYRGCK